jgi:hypothetical protein
MRVSTSKAQTVPNADSEPVDDGALIDDERRATIARLGGYAAYTAPAMLTLLLPTASHAQVGSPPLPPGTARQRQPT